MTANTFTQAELDAAVKAERDRCYEIVVELPLRGDPISKRLFWHDKCKSFAFAASTYIRSPELEADWRERTKRDLLS